MSKKEWMQRKYLEKKLEFISYLGGKCKHCCSTEDLQFDHIDPKEKKFNILKHWASNKTELLKQELDKCQLLCKTCHSIKTKEDFSTNRIERFHTHGSMYTWMKKKCKCEICTVAKNLWSINRNQKRRKSSQ
jgi:5-methylcytosine-specific restriction endonuclease McrA